MTTQSTRIELVTPFPRENYLLIHRWMLEHRERMLDNFWPAALDKFAAELDRRAAAGERSSLVLQDGAPVGFLGYARITPHLGTLRGVCFAHEVHGNGTALRALRTLLQAEFDAGVYKILAWPFADNRRARAFYAKAGGIHQGLLERHTVRGGVMVDICLMAFFAPQDGYSAGARK